MSDFKPGDRVKVTIENALIVGDGYDERYLSYYLRTALFINGDEAHGRIHLEAEGVTVERIVPAEWPPRAGDLWRDRHGELWFIHENPSVMEPRAELMGRTTGGARWTNDAGRLIDDNAPLSLVHREVAL